MRALLERLYPVCRSLTGAGVRETLDVIETALPPGVVLRRRAVPSGTRAFDWTVAPEWNVGEAWVADSTGARVIDLREHTLHLVSYSAPVRARMTWAELEPHLHTLPDQPDLVPYRTSYYHRTWGFCLTHRQLEAIRAADAGPYEVVVDSTLAPGEMLYGEVVLPGASDRELLLSAHTCHPSLANDNLSGIAVALEVVRALAARQDRVLTVRLVLAPGTVGSILWLSRNEQARERLRHGLVLTGLGDGGSLVYKRTRHGARAIDTAAAAVVASRGGEVRDYSPWGYDERQYNAPGFDLPVGRLSRTPHGEYPEYHTSGDDLGFVSDAQLLDAVAAVLEIIGRVEADRTYVSLSPYGEPQLGPRGLYPTSGGQAATEEVMAMLWLLAYADGRTSVRSLAERSQVPVERLERAAQTLVDGGLLRLEQ